MIFLLCLAFLAPIIAGYSVTYTLLPLQKPSFHYYVLKTTLTLGVGCGITSCSYFLTLSLFGPAKIYLVMNDVISGLAFIALFLYFFRFREKLSYPAISEDISTNGKVQQILTLGFIAALICSIGNAILRSSMLPHGSWDAWTIWNLRARFLYRGGSHWTDTFSTFLAPHHPDYPLLIPAQIARFWQFIGKETQVVPAIIAICFVYLTAGLLVSAVFMLRGRYQGLLAGLVLLGTPYYLIIGISQLADIPLGFFILATLVLISFQDRMSGSPGISLLAGIMAGFACWTKNEGLLFLLTVIIARLAIIFFDADRKNKVGQMTCFVAGIAPILLILLYYKVHFAPSNDIFAGQEIQPVIGRLMDLSRYVQITKALLVFANQTIPVASLLIIYPFYAGIQLENNSKKAVITLLIILFLMCSGYFAIYVISPYNLGWHLETSLPRLLMQLWPSVIFIYFLMVNTPEEMVSKQE